MRKRGISHRLLVILLDLAMLLLISVALLVLYRTNFEYLGLYGVLAQMLLSVVTVFLIRTLLGVYRQVWHYADAPAFMKLMIADTLAMAVHYTVQEFLPFNHMSFMRTMALFAGNLLLCMSARMGWQYLYKIKSRDSRISDMFRNIIENLTGIRIRPGEAEEGAVSQKTNIAIVGAGRIGTALADELLANPRSTYLPVFFIDNDKEKIGRWISGLKVFDEEKVSEEMLAGFPVQEVVFALPRMDADRARELYARYREFGCRVKVYDYPLAHTEDGARRSMREFDMEELLFRSPEDFLSPETREYYAGKTVLISGGGGSIGSELCRQIARMKPAKIVVLDVYENGAYDIEQELKIAYGKNFPVIPEIITVCDREELQAVFERHHPQIVLHAAAHKHVPLMERNCVEAVRNNVFGTLNIVDISEQYGVEKFIMISTDKAVNPTNVMGATKRFCERIVQSRTGGGTTAFSATRFGNVLGSNGSVIPLFRRQIAAGGPVTLTDLRIIRYFMTIREAVQLVLTSGAFARDGELFVLDMGRPVKILDLAESMIRLSGYEPYKDIDIIETGLRPGEKLYEELLVNKEEMTKTSNEKIFIEKDTVPSREEISAALEKLEAACDTCDDDTVRKTLQEIVPSFQPSRP